MSALGEIKKAIKGNRLVPLESVVSFAGVTKVFVIENNVARSRAVQVGRIRDGLQEILSGLTNGALVAVTGQNRLTDGAAVAIKDPDKTLADTRASADAPNERR